jgi:hypothetical protein
MTGSTSTRSTTGRSWRLAAGRWILLPRSNCWPRRPSHRIAPIWRRKGRQLETLLLFTCQAGLMPADRWTDGAKSFLYHYEAEHLGTIVPNADWYPASIFFQGMKYRVYGDPALALPRPSH